MTNKARAGFKDTSTDFPIFCPSKLKSSKESNRFLTTRRTKAELKVGYATESFKMGTSTNLMLNIAVWSKDTLFSLVSASSYTRTTKRTKLHRSDPRQSFHWLKSKRSKNVSSAPNRCSKAKTPPRSRQMSQFSSWRFLLSRASL